MVKEEIEDTFLQWLNLTKKSDCRPPIWGEGTPSRYLNRRNDTHHDEIQDNNKKCDTQHNSIRRNRQNETSC
jgi:hypothetical protein